uniref:Uncharacterized protein n=1 Tax=Trypanosoma congolense (strain IL3000) TaxID=1068625 RepID=G0UZ29_TRYCI|nr:conserved hypothetical protein [Trypanosoma congolense IL3000]
MSLLNPDTTVFSCHFGATPVRKELHNRENCECAHHSPAHDFSHILESPHVTFSSSSNGLCPPGAESCISGQPPCCSSDSVPRLQADSVRCQMCAQISGARRPFQVAEVSYLKEIGNLRGLAKQFDSERSEAIDQAETLRRAYERQRQQSVLKEREFQLLEDKVHRLQDKLQRTECQLASVQSICRRDARFHRDQELLLFEESFHNAREALISMEASWRMVLYERWAHSTCSPPVGGHSPRGTRCSGRSVTPCSSGRNGGGGAAVWMHDCMERPRSTAGSNCPSITRYTSERPEESPATSASAMNSGISLQLQQSKRSADETIKKLQRDLDDKNDIINSLQDRLANLEAEMDGLVSSRKVDESLVVDMQAEIEDMVLNELLLTHSCQRHALEAEAAEELSNCLWWMLQQHNSIASTNQFSTPLRTPATKRQNILPKTPETLPHFIENSVSGSPRFHALGSSVSDVCAMVSDTVLETMRKELQSHLLPLKLSVESMRASSEELARNAENTLRAARADISLSSPAVTLDDIRAAHTSLKDFIQQNLSGLGSAIRSYDPAELNRLREAVVKLGRLSAHNSKIMDDKLNDILNCQSAVSRHVVLSSLPCGEGLGTARTPETASPTAAGNTKGSTRKDESELGVSHGQCEKGGDKIRQPFNNSGTGSHLISAAFHDWDVESACSGLTALSVDASAVRKTPYDADDI